MTDCRATEITTRSIFPPDKSGPLPPTKPIGDALPDMQAEMLRYGQYQILVADNVSHLVHVTLGELNAFSCLGREFYTGLLRIARNAIDTTAQLHNNNLKNTLSDSEEVHVSVKEYFADVNNSSLHDEIVGFHFHLYLLLCGLHLKVLSHQAVVI